MGISNGRSKQSERGAPARDRDAERRWLLEVTEIPTVAGREWRVVEWIRAWVASRPELSLREDRGGNVVVSPVKPWGGRKAAARPIFITAHLDHPAFVVERVIGPGTFELAFRGGVNDEYFEQARVVIHAAAPGDGRTEQRHSATISGMGSGVSDSDGATLFKTYIAETDGDDEPDVRVGDVATWDLPAAEIDERGIVHTHACDDLSAVAAAVSAYDALLALARTGHNVQDVRLLFTRSEEIGFTGAIAACKLKTMPKNARVIALENSRSFADSPIGGGPIVRVGDRLTVFSPGLTAACAKRAGQIGTGRAGTLKWQRKLMAGGACEATVFCAYGYEATCLCLPLGNYHNMANQQDVMDKTYDAARLGPPRVGREFIAIDDYYGLIDLLVAIGMELPEQDPVIEKIEALYAKHSFVLSEGQTSSPGGRRSGRGLEGSAGNAKRTRVASKAKK